MLPKKIFFVLVWLALIVTGAATQAQLGDSPLVILMQGDLHAWDNGQLFRLTNNGHNSGPVISPQGRFVAYSAISPVGVRVLESGFVGDAPFPADIFIYDLQTNAINAIVLQPPNVRFMSNNGDDNFIMRSQPAWSPDGNFLAWSEMVMPGFAHRLMRYEVGGGRVSSLATLPEPGGFPGPAQVLWVGPTIVTQNFIYNDASGDLQDAFISFDQNGRQVGDVRLTASSDGATLMDVVAVTQGARVSPTDPALIGLHFTGGVWELLDPVAGTRQMLIESPEHYSLQRPGNSVALRTLVNFSPQLGTTYTWDLVSPTRQVTQRLPFTDRPSRIAIAPDGQSVAYVAADGVYIWLGQAQRIPGTEVVVDDFGAMVVWGPTGWRTPSFTASVVATIPPPPVAISNGVTCQGFLPSRLVVGQQGRVTTANNIPNNVRSGPGLANERMGQIPAGATFVILAGPICVGDTAWWQVRYQTLTGWTAEGAGNEYWLELVGPVVSATPSRATPSSTAQTYVIQRGDVLARIAQRFEVTVECLLQTNAIPDPNRIAAGETLLIDPAACG